MKFENLDKLFELYVQEAVRKNKEKYSSHEALEDDLGMLFNRFENVRIKTLDGKTPKEYAAELREDGEIFDYVSKCLENNIEVTDTICDEVVRAEGATEYLNGLLYENNKDAKLLAALLLKEIDDEEVEDIFISVLTNDEMPDDVKTVAFEYLSDGDDCVPEKILEIINSVPEKNQGILVEVLSNFKGRKDVFYWLVTMLQRAEDVPTSAGLLGRSRRNRYSEKFRQRDRYKLRGICRDKKRRRRTWRGDDGRKRFFGRSLLQVHKSYRG